MSTVHTKFTSDPRELEKSYEKIIRKNAKLMEQNQKLASQSRQGARQQKSGLDRSAEGIAKVALGWVSVGAAIGLATKAFQDHIQTQAKAAQTQMSVGDAQRMALINLGVVPAAERERLTKGVRKISSATGVSARDLYLEASSALSASAGDLDATLGAVRQAARLAPQDAATRQALSGAILDIGKITGDPSAKANLGLLAGVGQKARVVDPAKLGTNIVRGIVGVASRGDTAQEAGAFVAAITGAAADVKGAISSNAAINIAGQLEKAFPDLEDTVARVKLLQGDPAAFEKFTSKATFEAGTEAAVMQVLSGGRAGQQYLRFLDEIPTGKVAATQLDKLIGGIEATPGQRVPTLGRGLDVVTEQAALANQEAGIAGTIRSKLFPALEQAGVNFPGRMMGRAQFEALQVGGMGPVRAGQAVLSGIRNDVESGAIVHGLSESDQALLDALKEISAKLDKVVPRQQIPVPVLDANER